MAAHQLKRPARAVRDQVGLPARFTRWKPGFGKPVGFFSGLPKWCTELTVSLELYAKIREGENNSEPRANSASLLRNNIALDSAAF